MPGKSIWISKLFSIPFTIPFLDFQFLLGGEGTFMNLRWHGHSCFELSNDKTLVIDPHDGKSIGISPPTVEADIVLVSHQHFDHNSVKTVAGFNSVIVDEPGDREVQGVEITGYSSFHDDIGGEKRGENIIFKFKEDGIMFTHLGDLGHVLGADMIEKLRGVDILFIPIGGVFTIDAKQALDVVGLIKPKVAIPMHYRIGGLSLSIQNLQPFMDLVGDVEKVGNEIDFEAEDLGDETVYWVFSL